MTDLIVVISKVWPMEEIKENRDASTSMRSLDRQGQAQLPKPAVVSPPEKQARWESPRRTVLETRRVRWVNEPASVASCKQGQGECELEMSMRGRPSGGSISGTRDRGQSACYEEPKK
jgi:hypothetical protein